MATISKKNLAGLNMASGPKDHGFAIVTSDVDVYDAPIEVYVGGAGVVACEPWEAAAPVGTTSVNVTVPAGGKVPFRVRRVLNTGTTAKLLIGTV